MKQTPSKTRIAKHYLTALDPYDMTRDEIVKMLGIMAQFVDSMDAKSIAYSFYTLMGVGREWNSQGLKTLRRAVGKAYRKYMIEWFQYALIKRANLARGGPGVGKLQKGLQSFVKAIPDLVVSGQRVDLVEYLPPAEYLDPSKITPIGNKILFVVRKEYNKYRESHGIPKVAGKDLPFHVQWDPSRKQWYIPYGPKTYDYYSDLVSYGFRPNRSRRRWEYRKKKLPDNIRRDFRKVDPDPSRKPGPIPTAPPSSTLEHIRDWFDEWYKDNSSRFTRVFTEYARRGNQSYELVFSGTGKNPKVKFKRRITSWKEALKELRSRYEGHLGREPWLQVMDRFEELLTTTGGDKLTLVLDRMNNLEHSNGMFMEHFPKNIRSWYRKFLDRKFHARSQDILAQYIPDKDLKALLMFITRPETEIRPPYWGQDLPYDFPTPEKDPGGPILPTEAERLLLRKFGSRAFEFFTLYGDLRRAVIGGPLFGVRFRGSSRAIVNVLRDKNLDPSFDRGLTLVQSLINRLDKHISGGEKPDPDLMKKISESYKDLILLASSAAKATLKSIKTTRGLSYPWYRFTVDWRALHYPKAPRPT